MDEPQLVSAGSTIVLVARGWTDLYAGSSYMDLSGTIYKKSGIYMCISTD